MNKATLKISKNIHGIAAGLSEVLDEIAGEPIGFALIVFAEVRASYVSNVERKLVIDELKLLLDCWEAGLPDIAAHEVQ